MAFICHSNACHCIFPRINRIFARQQAHALLFLSVSVGSVFFLTLHIASTLITCSMIQWLMLCVFLLCNVFPFYLILSVIVTLTDTHTHIRQRNEIKSKKRLPENTVTRSFELHSCVCGGMCFPCQCFIVLENEQRAGTKAPNVRNIQVNESLIRC